jgi:hypothetical protein
MSSMANPGERIIHGHCSDNALVVSLADGRSLSAPLAWYPRLLHATPAERDTWEIAGAPAPRQAFELPVRRGH